MLACAALGHPSPQVSCSREGAPWPQRLHVSRQDAGTYLCLATNPHGAEARTITVGVECEWGQHQTEGPPSPEQAIAVVGLHRGVQGHLPQYHSQAQGAWPKPEGRAMKTLGTRNPAPFESWLRRAPVQVPISSHSVKKGRGF